MIHSKSGRRFSWLRWAGVAIALSIAVATLVQTLVRKMPKTLQAPSPSYASPAWNQKATGRVEWFNIQAKKVVEKDPPGSKYSYVVEYLVEECEIDGVVYHCERKRQHTVLGPPIRKGDLVQVQYQEMTPAQSHFKKAVDFLLLERAPE